MRKFLEKRINSFKGDKVQWGITALLFALLCLHVYQYIDSNFMKEPLIRICFCILAIPTIFLCGRPSFAWLAMVLAVALGLTITFNNYTAFLLVLLACFLLPKFTTYYLIVYAVTVFITCVLHDKTPVHLFIHYISCSIFFILFYLILLGKSQRRPLNLTDDEKAILEELRTGKQQKEITLFSQNTITKKLRDARNRNDIATTEELLMRYISNII